MNRRIPVRSILHAVAAAHGTTAEELRAANRMTYIVIARFHAVALLRELRPDLSLSALGRYLNHNRSTIRHAARRFHEVADKIPARAIGEVSARLAKVGGQ